MPHGTACNRLRKLVMYRILELAGNTDCFRCGLKIGSAAELSIDHKQDWQESSDPIRLFFDLDNIAFSHRRCNISAADRSNAIHASCLSQMTKSPAGMSWCNRCKRHRPAGDFYRNRARLCGLAAQCIHCCLELAAALRAGR
jgi:hypothetical protein